MSTKPYTCGLQDETNFEVITHASINHYYPLSAEQNDLI